MSPQPNDDPTVGVDSLIINAVDQVRNRFGAAGLRQLLGVAQAELEDTESALKDLQDDASSDD